MSELVFGPHPDFPDNEEAAYRRIAKLYRDKIISGDLQDGEKLPSERELCALHEVSTITARAAVNLLREWGLAQGVRGKGVFVRRLATLTRIAPQRYFRSQEARTYVREAEASGVDVNVEHETSKREAPREIARRLGITEGDPVTATSYFIRMGGTPVTMSVAWEPLAITGGTAIEHPHEGPHANDGIVKRFDAIGVHVNRVEERLTVRNPSAEEAAKLEVPRGLQVVEITQTFWHVESGADLDVAVETADIVFPADRYQLVYDMEIH
ncbi:GntR family transcriptional regulator [Actinokineospora sp. NPDC004072]